MKHRPPIHDSPPGWARRAPNFLSILRIGMALCLLALPPKGGHFWMVYGFCGLSDCLDGAIARRYGTASILGARLDSLGDIVFVVALAASLLPVLEMPLWLWICTAGIAVLRILSLMIGYRRFHMIASLHTYANKAAGLMLFCLLPAYAISGRGVWAGITCGVAALSAMEELIIQWKSQALNLNIRGCWELWK